MCDRASDPTQHDEPRARDWASEHWATQGRHYGLTGPGTSASTECPYCQRRPVVCEAGFHVNCRHTEVVPIG